MRTWVDSTGNFKVRAKLLSCVNGIVKIEKEDRRVVTFPVKKLSKNCQSYLTETASKTAEDANPFAGGTLTPSPVKEPVLTASEKRRLERLERERELAAEEAKKHEVDIPRTLVPESIRWNGELVSDPGHWKLKPDGFSSQGEQDNQIINFDFDPELSESILNVKACALSRDRKTAVASFNKSLEKRTYVQLVDLESRRVTNKVRVDCLDCKAIAVSNNRNLIGVVDGEYANMKLDVWDIADKKHLYSWRLSHLPSFFLPGPQVKQIHFVGDDHLLTIGNAIVLWEIATGKIVYHYSVRDLTNPRLSPQRNHVAFVQGDSLLFIDVSNGQVLGSIPTGSALLEWLAFSPDGQFIAAMGPGNTKVYSIADGTEVHSFSPRIYKAMLNEPNWLGTKYLLRGPDLFDLELGVNVWEYDIDSGGKLLSTENGGFWFVGRQKMVPISIPDPSLDELTAKIDPDELRLFKPGTEISIELDVPFSPEDQEKIRQLLTTMLRHHQVVIKEHASIKMIGTVETLPPQEIQFRTVSPVPLAQFRNSQRDYSRENQDEKLTYTPFATKVEFRKNGETFWSSTYTTNVRATIRRAQLALRYGKTKQEVIDELSTPTIETFRRIIIPVKNQQFDSGTVWRRSSIDQNGVVNK